MYVFMYVRVPSLYVCMYRCMCACMYVCLYVCMWDFPKHEASKRVEKPESLGVITHTYMYVWLTYMYICLTHIYTCMYVSHMYVSKKTMKSDLSAQANYKETLCPDKQFPKWLLSLVLTYIHTYMYVHTHIHVCAYTHTCMCAYLWGKTSSISTCKL